jgi:hypothetical protein
VERFYMDVMKSCQAMGWEFSLKAGKDDSNEVAIKILRNIPVM